MKEPEETPADPLVNASLDEEQLAQIDALIEQHSTPSHRVTREEIVQILVEKGRDMVEQGASLLPFLELDEDKAAEVPCSEPAPEDPAKH